jgi:N-acetylneuraminic acid mutarotase
MLSFTKSRLSAVKAGFAGKKLKYWKYCLTIVSLVLVCFDVRAQNGTWTRKADMPTLRGASCAVVINNKIYVLGGMDSSFVNNAVNEVYDPLRDTWDTTKQPMHYPRAFLSAVTVNDTIYAIGGGMPTTTQTVEAYDTATNTWTFKADMLSLRFGAAAGVIDGIIYNVGGNHYESNCEAYNPTTDEWTPKAPIPETYGGIIVAPYGGLLYAFGGGFDTTFSTTYAFDPDSNKWTKKTNMPTARGWSHPAPVVDGKIYVLGGYTKCYGEVLSDVEVYDPVYNSWTKLPDMPFKRALFATAVVNGKIYIIGGTEDWGNTGGKEVWEYTPSIVDVEQELTPPIEFALQQNYPNPFNPSTKISWQSPVGSWQTLKVYDILGNEVATLVDEYKPAGRYEVEFKRHSDEGQNLPSGVYFYQLRVEGPETSSGHGFVETKKMLLLK